MVRKRVKPQFRRRAARWLKRLARTGWRRPRGSQAKVRKRLKGRPRMPSVGWRAPAAVRGLHPSGLRERLVHSLAELEGVDPEREAVRVAHRVGKKKKAEIVERAKKLGVRVLNP